MLIPLNALNDNYIWLYQSHHRGALIIDPAESQPVLDYLHAHDIAPAAILITHNHHDHTGGITGIVAQYPELDVYAPNEVAGNVHYVESESQLLISGYTVEVLPTFGHTKGHISYVIEGHLFCGDSLFSVGCGRVFTGDYIAMYQGLQRLKALPDTTIVCPAHEYTTMNIQFALSLQPNNADLISYLEHVKRLRMQNKPSLPTTMALEKAINPFLLAHNVAEFKQLREAKDRF